MPCYTPGGTDRNEWEAGNEIIYRYAACNPGDPVSMCCELQGIREDACTSEELCKGKDGLIWRESCTDPTWQNPACIKLFINGSGYNNTPTIPLDGNPKMMDVTLTNCTNKPGKWCWATNNNGCCQQRSEGYYIINGSAVTAEEYLAALTKTMTAPESTPTGSPGNVTESQRREGTPESLSPSAKAGIAAGVGVTGLTVVVLGLLYIRRRRRGSEARTRELGGDHSGHDRVYGLAQSKSQMAQQLHSDSSPPELPELELARSHQLHSDPVPSELPVLSDLRRELPGENEFSTLKATT